MEAMDDFDLPLKPKPGSEKYMNYFNISYALVSANPTLCPIIEYGIAQYIDGNGVSQPIPEWLKIDPITGNVSLGAFAGAQYDSIHKVYLKATTGYAYWTGMNTTVMIELYFYRHYCSFMPFTYLDVNLITYLSVLVWETEDLSVIGNPEVAVPIINYSLPVSSPVQGYSFYSYYSCDIVDTRISKAVLSTGEEMPPSEYS